MGKIGYGYGSEWHLLRFLGYHRGYLSKEVLKITGGKYINWLDFRFSKAASHLNIDREFVGFNFIEDPEVINRWKRFWPQTGSSQNWDAVGKIDYGDHFEWLLVEAKAHLKEVRSSCRAKSQKSIDIIKSAMQKTIYSFCNDRTSVEDWFSPYYRYANRLASLHFLMKECDLVMPAHLLFIYFYGDYRPDNMCPQKEDDWHQIIEDMEAWLGIDKSGELNKRVHHLFLPVNPNQNSR